MNEIEQTDNFIFCLHFVEFKNLKFWEVWIKINSYLFCFSLQFC